MLIDLLATLSTAYCCPGVHAFDSGIGQLHEEGHSDSATIAAKLDSEAGFHGSNRFNLELVSFSVGGGLVICVFNQSFLLWAGCLTKQSRFCFQLVCRPELNNSFFGAVNMRVFSSLGTVNI